MTSKDPVLRAWGLVAGTKDVFRYPESHATAFADVVRDILPGAIEGETFYKAATFNSKIKEGWYVELGNGKTAIFKIFKPEDGGMIELDVADFDPGKAGSLMYHIAANWAYNNGVVFEGDRNGMKAPSIIRRTENMLSSAIRFGTTAHIAPGPEQMGVPMPGTMEIAKNPLEWEEGNDEYNMKQLLLTSHENVMSVVPELQGLVYNFNDGTFPLTDAQFDAIAESPGGRKAFAGRGTLKRTVVTSSVLQGRGPETVGAAGLRNDKSSGLEDTLYEEEAAVPPQRAEYTANKAKREEAQRKVAQAKAEAEALDATSSAARVRASAALRAAQPSEVNVQGFTRGRKGPLGIFDDMMKAVFQTARVDTATKFTGKKLAQANDFAADNIPVYRTFLYNVVDKFRLPEGYIIGRHANTQSGSIQTKETVDWFKAMTTMTPDQQMVAINEILNPSTGPVDLTPEQEAAVAAGKRILGEIVKRGIEAGTIPKDFEAMDKGALVKLIYKDDVLTSAGKTGLKRSSGIVGLRLRDTGLVVDASRANVTPSPSGKYHEVTEYAKNGIDVRHFVPVETADADVAQLTADGKDVEIDKDTTWQSVPSKTTEERMSFYRDLSAEEKDANKDMVSDPRYLMHTTVHHLVQDITHSELFHFLADFGSLGGEEGPGQIVFENEEEAKAHQARFADQGVRKQNWVQVPDTKNAAGGKKFGAIAGKWVPQSVWNDISAQVSNAPLFPLYDKWLTRWKLGKTAFSPVTQFNNLASNFALAFYRDVPAGNVINAAQVYWNYYKGTPEEQAAARKLLLETDANGVNVGSHSQNEQRRNQMLSVLEELATQGHEQTKDMEGPAALMKVMEMIEKGKASAIGRAAGKGADAVGLAADAGKWLYGMTDNVFRLASYMTHVQDGMTPPEAGRRAAMDFVDYDISAPWINAARRSILPFVAWPYRMIPAMIGIAIEKPWKFATMATALMGLNALGYAIAGGDEDDERRYLSDFQKGQLGDLPFMPKKQVRLPWANTFLDVSAAMPTGDLISSDNNGIFGVPWLKPLIPSGPLIMAAEALFGYDAFKGESLRKDTNSAAENFEAVMKHTAQESLPNIPVPGTRQFDSVVDILRERHGMTGAEYNNTLKILSMIGPKIIQGDPQEQKALQGVEIKKLYKEYTSAMFAAGFQEMRNGHPDQAKIQERVAELNGRFLEKLKTIQSP